MKIAFGILAIALAGCASPKEGCFGVFVDYQVTDAAGKPVANAPGLMRTFEDGSWSESELPATDSEGRGHAAMGFDKQPLLPPTEWEIWVARDKASLEEDRREKKAVRARHPGDFTGEDRVQSDAKIMNKFWFTKTIVIPEGK